MVTKYNVINFFEKRKGDPTVPHTIDEKHENIIYKDTGKVLATIDEYMAAMKKVLHCDFELIYDEHPSCFSVIRCKECGTVIFERYDEDYDPNLCCPTCGGYKTYFDFWTKEEIDSDEEKQKAIKNYEEMQRELDESYARRQKRGGLYDWEIWKKRIEFKKTLWNISLECDNLFYSKPKLKGLKLIIKMSKRDPEYDDMFVWKKSTRIPLSWYAFYIHCILPYSKTCPEELRKYHFWQKKPKDQEEG